MKLFKLFCLLVILISLGFFIRNTNFPEVANSLKEIGLLQFSSLLFFTFIAYLLGTIGWKYCLGEHAKAFSVSQLFMIRHIGETAGLLNPASIIGGEAVKLFLMKDTGITRDALLTSLIVSRFIMVITQLLVFFVSVAFLLFAAGKELPGFRETWGIISISALALLFLSILIFRFVPIKKPALLLQSIAFIRMNKKAMMFSSFFFILHWIIGAYEFVLILNFLGIESDFIQGIFIDMGVIFFKTAGAFIPGQIGIEEYGNKVMLLTIGVSGTAVWVSVSLLRRARQLFWILFGLVAYLIFYKKWGAELVKV